MNAVVLGASGLIGNAIVRELLARGHRVTAVGRRAAQPPNLAGLDVEHVRVDLDSNELPAERLDGQNVVIDAAAPYALKLSSRVAGGDGGVVDRAARRTDRLLRSLHGRDLTLVYVGTASSETHRAQGWSAVQSEWVRGVHPYFAVKQLIDTRLAAAAAQGQRVVTVRPTVCLGPYDAKPRDKCWVAGLIDGRIPVVPAHRLNVVDTRDVASEVVGAIETAYAATSLPVTGHNTTIEELFGLVCELAGVARPIWSVPAALGILPALWAELSLAVVGRESPIPALLPMLISEQDWVERRAPHGGGNLRPLRETVRDTLEWYRRLGYF